MKKFIFINVLLSLLATTGLAQDKPMGGVSTGEAKIYTTRRTTGIVDKNAPRIFEDVTDRTPLKDYRCVSGSIDKEYIVEATACTVAILDFDNDGRQDIYLLNGSTIAAQTGKAKPPK